MDNLNNSNIVRNYKKSVEDLKKVKASAFNLNRQTGTENYKKMSTPNGVSKKDAKYTISHDGSQISSNSNHSDANLFSDNRPFLCDSRTYYSKGSSHTEYSIHSNHFKRVADMEKQKITKEKRESNILPLNKAHLNAKNKFVKNNSAGNYGINLNKSLDKISKIRIMQKFKRSIQSHTNTKDEHRIRTFEHVNLFDKYIARNSTKARIYSNNKMKFKDSYHDALDSANTCDTEICTNSKKVYCYKSNSYTDTPHNSTKKYKNEVPKGSEKDISSNFSLCDQIKSNQTVIPSSTNSLDTKRTAIFNCKAKMPLYFHRMKHSEKLKNVNTPHLNNNSNCDNGNYANIKMGNNTPDVNALEKNNPLEKSNLTFGVNKRMEHLNLSNYLCNHLHGQKNVKQEHNIAHATKRKGELIDQKGANWKDSVIQFMNDYMEKKQYCQNLQKFNDALKSNTPEKINPFINSFKLRNSFNISGNSNVVINNKSTHSNYFKKTVEDKKTKSKLYENYVDFEKEFRDKKSEPAVLIFPQNNYDGKHHPHYSSSKNSSSAERTLSKVGEKAAIVRSEPLSTCANACKKEEIKKVSTHIINIPLNFKLKKKKNINYKHIIQDISSKREHNYTDALLTDRYRNFFNMENEQKQQNSNFNGKVEIFNKGEFLSSFLKKDTHDDEFMHVEKLFHSDVEDTVSNEKEEEAKQGGEDRTHDKVDTPYHNADNNSAQLNINIANMEKQEEHNSKSDLSTNTGACAQEIDVQEQVCEQMARLKEKDGDRENELQELSPTATELTQNFNKSANDSENGIKGDIQRAEIPPRNILEKQCSDEQKGPHETEQVDINLEIFEKEERKEQCMQNKCETCRSSYKGEEMSSPINPEKINDTYSRSIDNENSLKSCVTRDNHELHSLGTSGNIRNDGTSKSTISKFLKEEKLDEGDLYEYEQMAREQNVQGKVKKTYYSSQGYHTNGGNKYSKIEIAIINESRRRKGIDLQQEEKIITKHEGEEQIKEESVQGRCFKDVQDDNYMTPEYEEGNSEMKQQGRERNINDNITKGKTDKSNSLTSQGDVEHCRGPIEDDAKEEVSATNCKQQNGRNKNAFSNDRINGKEEDLNLESIRILFEIQYTEDGEKGKKEKKELTQSGYSIQDKEKLERYETEKEISPSSNENREDDKFAYKQKTKIEPKGDAEKTEGIEMETENMHKGDKTKLCEQKKDSNECEKSEPIQIGDKACIDETLNKSISYGNETNGEQSKNEKSREMDCKNCEQSNRELSEIDIPMGSMTSENDDKSTTDGTGSKNDSVRDSTTLNGTDTPGGNNRITANYYSSVEGEINEKNKHSPTQMFNDDNVNREIAHINSNKVTRSETITGCNPLSIEINKNELFKQLHIRENRLRHINVLYHSFDYDKGTVSKKRGNGPQNEGKNGAKNEETGEIGACINKDTKTDRTKSYTHITPFEEKIRRIFNLPQDENEGIKQRISIIQSKRNPNNESLNEKIGNQLEGNKSSDSNILREKDHGDVSPQNEPILQNTETEIVKEKDIEMEDKHFAVSHEQNKEHLIDHNINHSTEIGDEDDHDDDSDDNAEEKNILFEDIKRNPWLQSTNLSQNIIQYIQVESVKCIMLFCYLYKIKYFQGMHDMIISLFYLNLEPYEILCVFERILNYYAPYLYLQHSSIYSSPRINESTGAHKISSALSNITMQICSTNGKLFRLLFQYFFPYVSYYVDTAVSDTWPSLFFLNLSFSKFDNVFCLLYLWMRLIQMKNNTKEVTCDFILFILSFCMHKLRMVKKEFYEKRGLTSMFTNLTYALSGEDKKEDAKYTQEQTEKYSHNIIKLVHRNQINLNTDEYKGDDEKQATHEERGKQEDYNIDEKIHHPVQTKRKYTHKGDEKVKEIIRETKLSTYCSEIFSLFFEFNSSFDDHLGDKYKMHIDCIINDIPRIRDIIPSSFLHLLTKYNSAYQKKKKIKKSNSNSNHNSVKKMYGCTKKLKSSNNWTSPLDDDLCLHIKLSDLVLIHKNVEGYCFIFLRLVKCQIILSRLILINPGNLVIENFAHFQNVDEFVKHKKKLHTPNMYGRTIYIVLLYSRENNAKFKNSNISSNDTHMNNKHKTKITMNEKSESQNAYSNRVFFKRNNKKEYMCSEDYCESPVDNAYLKNLITTLVKNNFKRLTIMKVHPQVVKIKNRKNITEKQTTDLIAPVKENSFFFQIFNVVKRRIYQNIIKDNDHNENIPPLSEQSQNNSTKLALRENYFKIFTDSKIRKRINYSNRKAVLSSKNVMHRKNDENPPKKTNNDIPKGSLDKIQNKVDKNIECSSSNFVNVMNQRD
eukprot:XP_002259499.1 hypothetical protein, conserved in Plasmodium species [Plasmodium knowlesi strain H]